MLFLCVCVFCLFVFLFISDHYIYVHVTVHAYTFKDIHLANMAWWLKSAGALNFALSQE